MSSPDPKPVALLARPLIFIGLLSLSVITLVHPGASRMHAEPWSNCYWIAVGVPFLLLTLRLSTATSWRVPRETWLIWLADSAALLGASGFFSPYRGPSLWWTALPLSGLATFLLAHNWLRAFPKNRERLVNFQTIAAGGLMLVSIGYWLFDRLNLTNDHVFSASIFERRNPFPLGHANYTAGLALLSLPWLVRAAIQQRGFYRITAWVASVLALLAMVLSGSRGGLIGLGTLGIGTLLNAGLGWKKFIVFAGGAVAVAGLLALGNPRIRALTSPHSESDEPNSSSVQRTAMFDGGIKMVLDRPLFGWGVGSTPLAFPRYRQYLDGGAENILQLHNTPVEILATTGSVGFLLSVAFLALAFRNRSHAPVAAIALAGCAVFSLTDYQLDVPVIVFALAMLAAQLAPGREEPASRRLRGAIALATVSGIALIAALGERDPTPLLNTEALTLAQNPPQTGRAIALLNQSLALNPDQEIAHFNLGWLLVVSDPASAEEHFRAAARLVPDKGGVYFGIGLARLNQGNSTGAARALAVECLNDPQFLASPWWTIPAIAAQRDATAAFFTLMLAQACNTRLTEGWANRQGQLLAQLAPRLGVVSPGPEKHYRRERTGYPVLMRNLNLTPPVDLYDVREDPRFATSVSFPLPHKGWLPSPLLLKLLDDTLPKE